MDSEEKVDDKSNKKQIIAIIFQMKQKDNAAKSIPVDNKHTNSPRNNEQIKKDCAEFKEVLQQSVQQQ